MAKNCKLFKDLYAASMIAPAQIIQLKSLGSSKAFIGFLGTVYGFLQLVSSPIMGKFSDLFGKRFILIRSLSLTSFSYFLLSFGNEHIFCPIFFILMSRCITGIAKHSQMLCRICLSDLIPDSEKAAGFGKFNSISNIGFIIGPAVGGFYMSSFKYGFILISLSASLLFIIQACLVIYYLEDIPIVITGAYNETNVQVTSFSFWKSLEFCELQICIRFLLTFAGSILRLGILFVLTDIYSLSSSVTGIFISFQGLTAAVISFFSGFVHKLFSNVFKELFWLCILFLFSSICICWYISLKYFFIFAMLISACTALIRVSSLHAVTLLLPNEKLGQGIGFGSTVSSSARAIGPIVTGYLFDVNFFYPFRIATFSTFLAIFISWHLKSYLEKNNVRHIKKF